MAFFFHEQIIVKLPQGEFASSGGFFLGIRACLQQILQRQDVLAYLQFLGEVPGVFQNFIPHAQIFRNSRQVFLGQWLPFQGEIVQAAILNSFLNAALSDQGKYRHDVSVAELQGAVSGGMRLLEPEQSAL